MSGRIFQNVVLQLKENTDRTVGVIDGEGIVIACSELAMIGPSFKRTFLELGNIFLGKHVPAINAAGGAIVTSEGKTFKALNGWGTQFDYAAFAFGDNEISKTVCAMATVALNAAKSYYEEKHDRGSFIKDIISDNIMLGDIYVRAKELRVTADVPRGVFVVRTLKKGESVPTDVIQSLFPDRQNDFVLSIGEGDVVLIRQMPEGSGIKELNKIASSIEEALRAGGEPTVVVGIGTVATHLRDLAKSYKEAQIAIEVGKVFDTEKYVINYENLGIGRLIYQLPTTLCEMFLQEVFKKNPIDALDKETLFTIHKFFENNLNVSETARKLFVHRNTLVYRLEKIKKLTGLDLREFDDAITFKVALMVKKYLTSRGIDS
jgi:carbohydrate diacid regulator